MRYAARPSEVMGMPNARLSEDDGVLWRSWSSQRDSEACEGWGGGYSTAMQLSYERRLGFAGSLFEGARVISIPKWA